MRLRQNLVIRWQFRRQVVQGSGATYENRHSKTRNQVVTIEVNSAKSRFMKR